MTMMAPAPMSLNAGLPDLSRLSRKDIEEFLACHEELNRRRGQRVFYSLFPDETTVWEGPDVEVPLNSGDLIYARRLYTKHLEHFAAGARYRERCLMAANRSGKTVGGGYEDACHLTGLYPDWWEGKRFNHPTDGWIAGKSNESTRDILQKKLLGKIAWRGGRKTVTGTGIIPGEKIGIITWKQGISDLVDTVQIKHISGGWSTLGIKSYQQGRDAFEGTEKDFIHLDEEPPLDIYGECLIRTMTTGGIVVITFTPIDGLSEVVLQFMPQNMQPQET